MKNELEPVIKVVYDKEKKQIIEQEDYGEQKFVNAVIEERTITDFINYSNKIIYGQKHAKETIALTLQNIHNRLKYPWIKLEKSNVLLPGPTGCGKTLLIDTLAKYSGVPVAKINLTGITSEGYVGQSISSVFRQLEEMIDFENDNDPELDEFADLLYEPKPFANYAIICLDEIDKIADQKNHSFGEKLQDELIGWIQEKDYNHELSTKNIIFIGTGSFTGLENIIKKRLKGKAMGFTDTKENKEIKEEQIFSYLMPQDLIEFGLKPELVGRFTNIGYLTKLSQEALKQILDMPQSYLTKQRKMLRKTANVKLRITNKAKIEIAEFAYKQGTYARGLQTAIDRILRPIWLNIEQTQNQRIRINEKTVKERTTYIN